MHYNKAFSCMNIGMLLPIQSQSTWMPAGSININMYLHLKWNMINGCAWSPQSTVRIFMTYSNVSYKMKDQRFFLKRESWCDIQFKALALVVI